MIPYGRQSINEADIEAVVRTLRSDYLTQGPAVPEFERALQRVCSAAHVIAVNSATSALHLAMMALDVGPGDRVWTSPITFVASANAARYCGADVDFVDIESDTWNMSPQVLADMLEQAERAGRLPKVIVPVHFGGASCDMPAIHRLATRYGCRIVEDASHAVGASLAGQAVGCCQYSDIAVLSFHPVKIVTTGEGGALATNDDALAERLRRLRSHGITRDSGEWASPGDGPWYYEQLELGYNYRMCDLQAALGTSQLDRLAMFVERRREIAAQYAVELRGAPYISQVERPDVRSSYHLYAVRLARPKAAPPLRSVHEAMRAAGIGVNLHYIPVYRQPYYRDLGVQFSPCPAAEEYYGSALSLPMFPSLTPGDFDRTIAALRAILPW